MENSIDLRKCKPGDLLKSSQEAILDYIGETPFKNISYLDHVVRYSKDKDNITFPPKCCGSRTHNEYVF